MGTTQYRCKNEQRRAMVRQSPDGMLPLNGIDYLEVTSDQKILVVSFLHPLPGPGQENPIPARSTPLTEDNILISGGIRVTNLRAEAVTTSGNRLLVHMNQIGDFSAYTLHLVQSPAISSTISPAISSAISSATSPATLIPPFGFDPQLAQVSFSFWVEASSEFDCRSADHPPDQPLPPPVIDYLSKDYASFRQLMFDRLAVTMPQWQERSAADVGVMLVELVAYAADYLSYYQDAVATETYLGTARRRVSVRRHARLLDYFMHEGCNARTWVVINVNVAITLPGPNPEQRQPGTQLLTRTSSPLAILPSEKVETALQASGQVFETLHEIDLHPACNQIEFYTWDDLQCVLPKGATQATFLETPVEQAGKLHQLLHRDKVLILEEVLDATSGQAVSADRTHCHAVRLTRVTRGIDPLHNRAIVEVEWSPEDALPFDLAISSQDERGHPIANISVARGNVLLVDGGRTVPIEELSRDRGWNRLRPQLRYGPLTQQGYVRDRNDQWVLFDVNASATAALQWELRNVQPAIEVWEAENSTLRWQLQRDLLNSDRFARDFVVETEDDGRAYLRFGDDALGKRPRTALHASYRVGSGTSGNVGAEAIAHVIRTDAVIAALSAALTSSGSTLSLEQVILSVRNPLPAKGGTDAEPIDQVKLYAPQAFRTQQRAVTEADYAAAAEHYPQVQRAIATRRWTGSWYTIFITVDRQGGRPLDDEFKAGLQEFLEGFRLAGHDIAIDAPQFVPLDIAMTVQVAPNYYQGAVKRALLTRFGSGILPTGELAFFHADRFSFGDPVYLSQVIAAAVQVDGVNSAQVIRLQRWSKPPNRELEMGRIVMERLEILRLDNTPNAPENGRIIFNLEGGL